jgi:transposase-like protein
MRDKKQMYKCKECGYVFHLQNKAKAIQGIWKEYVHQRRTYEDLA